MMAASEPSNTRSDFLRGPLPATSLIIPSRNRPGILAETVASVLAGDEVPTELIVIDQSDAEHPDLAHIGTRRGCKVRYIWSPGRGLSRARNQGIEAARHEVLVFTDDDVRVSQGWFATLVRALLGAGPAAVVTGQVPPAEERADGFVPSTKVDPVPAVYEGRIGADVLYPHNMAMHRSLVESVGEFDVRLGAGTHFAGSEDNDFAFRLLEAGHRIIYVPEAVVYHRAWRSASAYLPLRWSYGRGQGAFYGKHFNLRDRYMLWRLAQEVRQRSGRFFRLLPRDPRRATGQLVCVLGVLSGFAEWLITRPGRT
jgi:GT2 family glycosyltransferase